MARMELFAGDVREILAVLATEDVGGAREHQHVRAHLPLSGGMDPTWLDFFAEAVRVALDSDAPSDFIDARIELGGARESLTIERVEPGWISAVARIPDSSIDAVAGRWIDRLEDEIGILPAEEKPWIRELAGEVVAFCRTADQAPDVVFVFGLS